MRHRGMFKWSLGGSMFVWVVAVLAPALELRPRRAAVAGLLLSLGLVGLLRLAEHRRRHAMRIGMMGILLGASLGLVAGIFSLAGGLAVAGALQLAGAGTLFLVFLGWARGLRLARYPGGHVTDPPGTRAAARDT